MSPLRRREAAVDVAPEPEPVPESPESRAGKGRVTPRRSDARAARAQQMKRAAPKTKAEARDRRRELMRETRQSLSSTDVSKLPPNERVPELVYVRDLIDSRVYPGQFLIFVMLAFLLVSTGGRLLILQYVSDAILFASIALLALSFLTAARLQERVRGRYPASTVPVRFYAFRRMIAPRRMRKPVPRLKRGAAVD